MSRNDNAPSRENQPTINASESLDRRASSMYSAPRLVVLGRACTLVQGGDLYKMTVDADRQYYHD